MNDLIIERLIICSIMIESSAFLAVFPYAFLASFAIFGIIVVSKWELDSRRRRKINLQS